MKIKFNNSDNENRLFGNNPSRIYYAPQNIYGASINLIHFAFAQFNRATCIRKLNQLEELIVENGETTTVMNEEKIQLLKHFIFDGLVDAIRISICYENFTKALLLTNGCIVHSVKLQHSITIHNQQRKEPIFLKNYLPDYPFYEGDDREHRIPGITNKTITLSTILNNSKYLDLLKIPSDIVNSVKALYSKRNEVHFYVEEHFKYGVDQIEELKKLKEYTNSILVQNNNRLVEQLDAPESQKLSLDLLEN